MDDCFNFFLLEDLETLESIERRSIFIPEHRNNDLNELDEDDFRRRYRFYKGTIETHVELLRTKLDSATGRNHALTAAEKVLAAVRFFAFGNRQINVGDLHSISQPSTSSAITDDARALAELRPLYMYLPQTEDERMQESFIHVQ
ncbi:nuclease HARBI1 [Trichonephila clavata]|uniref:Nuclease HARBI1 n=1 Tax=Trichonephila clavata TaxID=2740835 RepID=A0A8X6L171_TRICU|nr:nuclease HARBI1 [Trichonephila clavata]